MTDHAEIAELRLEAYNQRERGNLLAEISDEQAADLAALQDVRDAAEAARKSVAEVYRLIDSDNEAKAMKLCRQITDSLDAALAAAPKDTA